MLLAGEWTSSGAVCRLDPDLVLAEAWRPDRLRRCRERLAQGEQAPAIAVVGFRLDRRRVLYGVSDGMHRTIAHREAGRRITAKISGYCPVEPGRHVLDRDYLWCREAEELRMQGIGAIPEELRPVLLGLEVKAV